jgi:hypothetical protein
MFRKFPPLPRNPSSQRPRPEEALAQGPDSFSSEEKRLMALRERAKRGKRDEWRQERALKRGLVEKKEDIRKIHASPEMTQRVLTPGFTHILRTTPTAEALIADYYARRYGIDITIIDAAKHFKSAILHTLAQHPEEFMAGFFVPGDGHSAAVVHVTPLVLGRQKDLGTYAITLDSAEVGQVYLWAKAYVDWVFVADARRQVDRFSCRTDAMVILKDALRHPHLLAELQPRGAAEGKVQHVNLPAYLLKTVQNPSFAPELMRSSMAQWVNEAKSKTLGQHREQHLRTLRVQVDKGSFCSFWPSRVEKQWNTFLLEKGHEYAALADLLYDEAQACTGQAEIEAIVKRHLFSGIRYR